MWETVYDPDVDPVHVHGHPLDDVIEHDVTGPDCACAPVMEWQGAGAGVEWVAVHPSLDGREGHEGSTPPAPAGETS